MDKPGVHSPWKSSEDDLYVAGCGRCGQRFLSPYFFWWLEFMSLVGLYGVLKYDIGTIIVHDCVW